VLKATYAAAQAECAIEQAWVQYGDDGGTEDDQAGRSDRTITPRSRSAGM
jgi:hypothetical protein